MTTTGERFCLYCVWFGGTEHDVMAEHPARCELHRRRVYADDTCPRFVDEQSRAPLAWASSVVDSLGLRGR